MSTAKIIAKFASVISARFSSIVPSGRNFRRPTRQDNPLAEEKKKRIEEEAEVLEFSRVLLFF